MEQGLYKVTFQTQMGLGTGVVFIREGHLAGGDSVMYYIGEYTLRAQEIEASVVADTHSVLPGVISVLGLPRAHLRLKGTFEAQSARLSGTSPEFPALTFQATLTRLEG